MGYQKYTYKYVKQTIEHDGNKLLSDTYVKAKAKIQIECGTCHHKYDISFTSYKQGAGCVKCAIIKNGEKRRTKEDDVKKLMQERGDRLIKLYFVQNRARVDFQCGKCDKVFTLILYTYQKRKHCPCENVNPSLPYDSVKELILKDEDILMSATHAGHVITSSQLVMTPTRLKIECAKCSEIYELTWNSFRRGSRCGLCSKSKKKTIDDFINLVEADGDKMVSTEYKNCVSEVDVQCGKCEEIFKVSYSRYRQGNRCPDCANKEIAKKLTHSQEYVEKYIKDYGDTLVSHYINMASKIYVKCGICCNIFNLTFSSYKSSMTRCSCITKSKGERKVEEYLNKHNIRYEAQKTFPGCKRKIALRFDYYLPDYDVLIEFDGSIHFFPIEILGGIDTLNNRRESDIIKNIYCIKNNQKLLRISYNYIKTVGKIVDRYLNNDNNNIIEYSSTKTYADMITETYEQLNG